MNKKLVYGIAAVVGIYFVAIHKNAAGKTLIQGLSSQPSSKTPFTAPQAARADTNTALNNQPFAQKIVQGVSSSITSAVTPAAVASAAGSVANVFANLFSSSTGSSDQSTPGDVGSDVAAANADVGSSNTGGAVDSSFTDGSIDDSSNFGLS